MHEDISFTSIHYVDLCTFPSHQPRLLSIPSSSPSSLVSLNNVNYSFHRFLPFICLHDTSGDRECEDAADHSSTITWAGTGAGGAARRVAPSVLGASRRSSLSAPLRVLPRPGKEEEGNDDGSALKRR